MQFATESYLAGLQAKADAMKEKVLATKSDWHVVGVEPKTIYYFAENGNDENDGLTEETPKQTLAEVDRMPLEWGDVVLFKRGDLFRGNFRAKSGVTYSAYGEGDKPTISSSVKNHADPALWEPTEYPNIWHYVEKIRNVGIITFDHSGKLGDYNQPVGDKRILEVRDFTGVADLDGEYQFYSDFETNDLWLWCEMNPGEKWKDIEIGYLGNTIDVHSVDKVTIDNLHVTLTGSHGVGAGQVTDLVVRNCVFDWLGGSILRGHGGANRTRYGNAVEVYGACDGYKVYNNWIYQIYDTGITHQFSRTPSKPLNVHNDVDYYDNLIEYCFWAIEYYNCPVEGCERVTSNVHVHDNFCRFCGEGWGCPGRADRAPMYHLGLFGETVQNYVTENNIFQKCLGYLFTYYGGDVAVLRNNTYIQPLGWKMALIDREVKLFDETAPEVLKRVGEYNPELVYMNPLK